MHLFKLENNFLPFSGLTAATHLKPPSLTKKRTVPAPVPTASLRLSSLDLHLPACWLTAVWKDPIQVPIVSSDCATKSS